MPLDYATACYRFVQFSFFHTFGEGKRAKTLSLQETGQRADSVHPVERSHSFYHLDIHRHPCERAGIGDRGGSAVGAKYIVRGRRDTTQTVLNIEGAQGCSPWSPPQEGARDQSSSARRGLPSKGGGEGSGSKR